MGILFSRPKQVEKQLDSIQEEILAYREYSQRLDAQNRSFVRGVMMLGFVVSSATSAYAAFSTQGKHVTLYSIFSFLVMSVVFYCIILIANKIYVALKRRSETHLVNAEQRKQQLLEQVKSTATFNEATKLLEKYNDASEKKIGTPVRDEAKTAGPQSTPLQRASPLPTRTPLSKGQMPDMAMDKTPVMPNPALRAPAAPMPIPSRPVKAGMSSSFDRFLDFLLGVGPEQRYALICKFCHAHNGLTQPAEFEHAAFICFLCQKFNAARKPRDPPRTAPEPDYSKAKRNETANISAVDATAPNK